jgi:hypothetical protein
MTRNVFLAVIASIALLSSFSVIGCEGYTSGTLITLSGGCVGN